MIADTARTEREPGEKTLAALGGNPGAQLAHLRAHRDFQKQERFDRARISWTTDISRAQSRRHILKNLHAKINAKDPTERSRGQMDTPEAQENMQQLARRVRDGHRVSPGDGWMLRWELRRRMTASAVFDTAFTLQDEVRFPREIRERLKRSKRLRELLRAQGASPRHHRQAAIIQVYPCRQCHNVICRELVESEENPFRNCPVCRQSLREPDLVEVAVRHDGSGEPLGSVECHRR